MSATIVVVDDEMSVVQMIRASLESEGYKVIPGFDGQMALNLAKMHRPELMIMDVNMPMTNGLKALEFLRKTPETSAIPVIFLTGAQSAFVYPVLEKAQRVAFLKKPVDLEHLSEMVREFLRRYPKAA